MDDNYYITLRAYQEMATRESILRDIEYRLDNERYRSWCKDDPNLDTLRQNAKAAVEAYANALSTRLSKETDRLYDKLDSSDYVINLSNLFKKRHR